MMAMADILERPDVAPPLAELPDMLVPPAATAEPPRFICPPAAREPSVGFVPPEAVVSPVLELNLPKPVRPPHATGNTAGATRINIEQTIVGLAMARRRSMVPIVVQTRLP